MTAFLLVMVLLCLSLLAYESYTAGKQYRVLRLKLYNLRELLNAANQRHSKERADLAIKYELLKQRHEASVDCIYKRIGELELELAAFKKAVGRQKS